MVRTIDLLPPLKGQSKSFGAAVRAAAKRGAKYSKPQFSIPKMKQVAKLAQSLGKEVTGLTVNGDGGFTVATGNPAISDASGPNEWD